MSTKREDKRSICFGWAHHNWILDARRALYRTDGRILLLSDLHLGKAQHFQKAGIGIPNGVSDDNFKRLHQLILDYEPLHVIFLGDLFHSRLNSSWVRFADFLSTHPKITFTLVKGNHDILPQGVYDSTRLHIYDTVYVLDNLVMTHFPLDEVAPGYFNMAGHVHPGVLLKGKARQGLRLPCFYFGSKQAILPAFGAFTGLHIIKPQKGDRFVAIVEDALVSIQQQPS